MRSAFFRAYDGNACDFVPLDDKLQAAVARGVEYVSAGFVTPYPPGFPVLVPGQVVSEAIVDYLLALDVKEIHGFEPELGLRIFRPEIFEEVPGIESGERSRQLAPDAKAKKNAGAPRRAALRGAPGDN
jgi:arginine decarboxylase